MATISSSGCFGSRSDILKSFEVDDDAVKAYNGEEYDNDVDEDGRCELAFLGLPLMFLNWVGLLLKLTNNILSV